MDALGTIHSWSCLDLAWTHSGQSVAGPVWIWHGRTRDGMFETHKLAPYFYGLSPNDGSLYTKRHFKSRKSTESSHGVYLNIPSLSSSPRANPVRVFPLTARARAPLKTAAPSAALAKPKPALRFFSGILGQAFRGGAGEGGVCLSAPITGTFRRNSPLEKGGGGGGGARRC